jgi:UDP-N-acetylmuramate dehydrogenase
MTDLYTHYSLQKLNTFGLDIHAARFCRPKSLESLTKILEQEEIRELPRLIIGEGSNLLFMSNFEGIVINPGMAGIEVLEDDGEELLVRVGASENWDQWVRHATEKGWHGLENLSLIPGSVGSAPVQNIGAYGVELKEHFAWLEAWDLKDNQAVKLDTKACKFGYRSCLFKNEGRGRYLITHVIFRLNRTPGLILDYGKVRSAFTEAHGKSPADLRNIIIHIRNSKLPDPKRYGNGGSFFKNPLVGRAIYNCIRVEHPKIPYYPDEENRVKIPAAWLIEQAGWKDKRVGNVGTWPTQPLVIVNYGGASGQEIYEFTEQIVEDVDRKFGISLEREVQLI